MSRRVLQSGVLRFRNQTKYCKITSIKSFRHTLSPKTHIKHFASTTTLNSQHHNHQPPTMLPLLTLEEHYVSTSLASAPDGISSHMPLPPHLSAKLLSLSTERITDMDTSCVALQVLSHAPLDTTSVLCTQTNNELHASISQNPSRFAAFALLPMGEPEAAAKELERCVKELGFVGALVNNHMQGRYYDDAFFWPVFAKAEALDVPIYIHPAFAAEEMMPHFQGNYDSGVAGALSAYGWGWHVDTALTFLRLYCAGLFDRFPRLKIVIGHMGELLPFQYERLLGVSERMFGRKERGLDVVWDENLWVTTSGMFSLSALECLLKSKRKSREKVLFSIDYPFSGNEKGRRFVEEIEESGLLGGEELRAFAYGNAEKLLKLKLKV
ncbi:putative metal-dependent hydrolase [Mollisia scopiformis]|uniref:Putative metal-dependent hydrolase n=1 Tax=Mollisia scopiformis TaxID=149040 RepID=A0A194XLY7_MOLSC|nr:putative metal-dependent hydrolase [Mollisia scopiformis]KUJ21151.1 putative metal-dependent hydrolase [Mollisia scopiformis]